MYIDMFIELNRGCIGGIKYFQFLTKHFDLAGRHIGINSSVGTQPYSPFNLNDKFITHVFGNSKTLNCIGVVNYLRDAFAVAHIQKNHTAMISTPVHPTVEQNGLIKV